MIDKKQFVDKVEVLEDGVVQVRTTTVLVEGEVELAKTYHRHCVVPGQDFSTEDKMVQDICAVVHTRDRISAYAERMEKQQ